MSRCTAQRHLSPGKMIRSLSTLKIPTDPAKGQVHLILISVGAAAHEPVVQTILWTKLPHLDRHLVSSEYGRLQFDTSL